MDGHKEGECPRRIFIISDLHLGGSLDEVDEEGRILRFGTRICRSQSALRDFIDWVRSSAQEPVELIINGDLVDFLAVDQPEDARVWISDQAEAVRRLEIIAGRARDPGGRGPFEAMRDLTRAGHSLTITLGNHDVELALPEVRACLARLAAAGPGRFELIHDGEACVRGGKIEGGIRRGGMLIEHGNRYDPWNIVDFTRLRQECAHLSRRLPETPALRAAAFFAPPAGTLLVVNAINYFLKEYPFLNLLKPEERAVVPLLLAIRPNLWPLLERCFALGKIPSLLHRSRMESAATPALPALLSGRPAAHGNPAASTGEFGDSATLAGELRNWLGPDQAALFVRPPPPAPAALTASRRSETSVFDALRDEAAALARAAEKFASPIEEWRNTREAHRRRALLTALQSLAADGSFKPDEELPGYLEAAREIAREGGFSHVVFGHTHLPKRIPLEGTGGAVYFNTGTWADTIRVPAEIFSSDETEVNRAFEAFFAAMQNGGSVGGYLQRNLTYLEAELDAGGGVRAATLRRYGGPGAERSEPGFAFSPRSTP